jgi:predicted ATPase
MIIKRLRVDGFRSLKQVDWEPGRLNVIIGPNGAGKSNVLRLLSLLAESAEGRLADAVTREGGMQSLLWDGRASEFRVCVESEPAAPNDAALYALRIIPAQYFFGTYRVEEEHLRGADAKHPKVFIHRKGEQLGVLDEQKGELVTPSFAKPGNVVAPQSTGLINSAIQQGPSFKSDETVLSIAAAGLSGSLAMWRYWWELRSIGVYQALRTDPDADIRKPPVTRLDQFVASHGQNLINVLHTRYTGDRSFKRSIDDAMKAAFGSDYEEFVFPPASDQRIQFRIRWRSLSREQSLAEVSDGTLRFLYLLTILATAGNRVIAIDEPETGLHPAMFSIIADFAEQASRTGQVIFTTHSAQFLNAFTATMPTTTVMRWIEGETKMATWSGEKLQKWLRGYSLGQLFDSGELEAGV